MAQVPAVWVFSLVAMLPVTGSSEAAGGGGATAPVLEEAPLHEVAPPVQELTQQLLAGVQAAVLGVSVTPLRVTVPTSAALIGPQLR